jgi:outer membrane protein assembly factor BamB
MSDNNGDYAAEPIGAPDAVAFLGDRFVIRAFRREMGFMGSRIELTFERAHVADVSQSADCLSLDGSFFLGGKLVMRSKFVLLALLSILNACGGGSGPSTPSASVSVSSIDLTQTSLTTDPAPILSVTATFTNPPSSGIYIAAGSTTNGIQSIQFGGQTSLTSGIINIDLKPPGSLTPNTYSDTVQLKFCLDKACANQIANSPQTVAVKYIVNLPTPTVASINSPMFIYAGSAAFTISLIGSDFTNQSVGQVNGSTRPTTFVSAGQIDVTILATDVVRAGTLQMSASNAAGGGGVSSALPLQILGPSITSLSTQTVLAGSPGFTLTVSGNGYWPQSIVRWNGIPKPTTYSNSSQLVAQISTADLVTAGTNSIAVLNASGDVSNPFNIVVQPLPPLSLTSIAPASVSAGRSVYNIVLTGDGFSTQAVAKWNGVPVNTTFISSLQLLAVVPAANIATPTTAAITVSDSTQTTSAVSANVVAHGKDAVAFQVNASHNGTINFNAVTLPTKQWSVNVGGSPSFAVIANGNVYLTVTTAGGTQLVAIDQATGATAWGPFNLIGPSNATFDAGVLLVLSATGLYGGQIQGLNPATGAILWSTSLGPYAGIPSAPTAEGGIVYESMPYLGTGELLGFDVSNGAEIWGAGPVFYGAGSTPAVTVDGVYASYPCATYDFKTNINGQSWSNVTNCNGSGGATPVVANGVLYSPNATGTYNGTTLNATTGAPIGTYVADNPPAITATIGNFLQSGTLQAISLSNQVSLWNFSGDNHLVTSPIVVNQYVFVGSSAGEIYALDQTTGQVLWQDNVGSAIPASAGWNAPMPLAGLSAGDGLLVVPGGNTVTAYRLSTSP